MRQDVGEIEGVGEGGGIMVHVVCGYQMPPIPGSGMGGNGLCSVTLGTGGLARVWDTVIDFKIVSFAVDVSGVFADFVIKGQCAVMRVTIKPKGEAVVGPFQWGRRRLSDAREWHTEDHEECE